MAQGPDARSGADAAITILLAGDTGFNASNQSVRADGVVKNGSLLRWSELLTGIPPSLMGDIGFANMETVITDRNDLTPTPKAYNFRTHPAGVRELVRRGFSLLSLANNHSIDYGAAGILETLKHIEALRGAGLRGAAGIGRNREEALAPSMLEVSGHRIAFSAVGIGTTALAHLQPTATRPGQLDVRSETDMDEVGERLARADAAARILSFHFGIEYDVRPSAAEIEKWRSLGRRHGIDVLVGHHPHVVRGIELVDGRLILYSLGNFLHHGTRSLAGHGVCRDFGLLARVHLAPSEGRRLAVRAVEAIPIVNTHVRPQRMARAESHRRIGVLNALSQELAESGSGARSVQFRPQPDGSGLFCVGGAAADAGTLGQLCRGWAPVEAPERQAGRRLRAACD